MTIRTAWLPQFFDHTCDPVDVRTAYRCRAYPDAAQQQVLTRTFGCVRVVWNRTLAAQQVRYAAERKGISYAGTDRALTAMKKDPALAFLSEVSSVPLQQALRNRHLARAISDCGWGEFRRQLAYKCQRYGRHLLVTGRWYPSSKTCSACGHRLEELSLKTRYWTCPGCGARHDRDINAAKNILAAGLAVSACGAGVRHSGSSRMRPVVKQEPQPVTAGIPILQGGE
jgi:transposase